MSRTSSRRNRIKDSLIRRRNLIITITVLVLLVIVLAPQTDALWRSMAIVGQATPLAVAIACGMTIMTYFLSTEVYHLLLKHPVKLRSMLLVQAATALTSRVAPIGIGTMGLNAIFLRRRNHTLSEALAVVTTNNALGITGHLLLLSIIVISVPLPPGLDIRANWQVVYWIMLVLAAVCLATVFSNRLREKIGGGLANVLKAISGYRHSPGRLLAALAVSMSLSLVYVTALFACGQALGLVIPFGQYFIVYSFSIFTGLITPTPGGLVGVEAGLVGGLVAYGVPAETALAVALLYRLITYWLPLLPGFIAFRVVQHRYL